MRNTHGEVTLLKVTLLHRCFSFFLNCKNSAKSRKASQINHMNRDYKLKFYVKLINFNLTHFIPIFHLYTPWKRPKTFGFLTFSGGIEMRNWVKMDLLLALSWMFNIVLSVKDNHGNTKLKVHVVLSSWTQGLSLTFIRHVRSVYVLYPGICVLYFNCTQNCLPHAYASYPSLIRILLALPIFNTRLNPYQ